MKLFFGVMTTANLSADETQNTVEQLYRSDNLTAEIQDQLTFISVLNIFLSITAFLGKCFDPGRAVQGVFSSFAVQSFAK